MAAMRYVALGRVSTDAQGSNLSKDVQFASIHDYAKNQQWECVVELFDTASGSEKGLQDRDGLKEALRLIKEKEADYLVMYDVSRMGREASVVKDLIEEVYSLGGKVGVATERRVFTSSLEARKLLFWNANVSEYEWLQIKERTQRGKKRAMELGGWVGSVPYGYRTTKVGQVKHLVPDEYEGVMLHKLFDLLKSGMSKAAVSKELNAIDNRRKWTVRGVSLVLDNLDKYSGQLVTQKVKLDGSIVENQYQIPPLLNNTEYVEIRALSLTVKRRDKKGRTTPFLGLARCSCGSGLYVNRYYENKDGTPVFAMGCLSRNREAMRRQQGKPSQEEPCKGSVVSTKIAEKVKEFLSYDAVIGVTSGLSRQIERNQKRIEAIKAEVNLEIERRNKIADMIVDGMEGITDALNERLLKIAAVIKAKEEEIKQYEKSNAWMKKRIDGYEGMDYEKVIEEIKSALETNDHDRSNLLLAKLGVYITVDLKGTREVKAGLLRRL